MPSHPRRPQPQRWEPVPPSIAPHHTSRPWPLLICSTGCRVFAVSPSRETVSPNSRAGILPSLCLTVCSSIKSVTCCDPVPAYLSTSALSSPAHTPPPPVPWQAPTQHAQQPPPPCTHTAPPSCQGSCGVEAGAGILQPDWLESNPSHGLHQLCDQQAPYPPRSSGKPLHGRTGPASTPQD